MSVLVFSCLCASTRVCVWGYSRECVRLHVRLWVFSNVCASTLVCVGILVRVRSSRAFVGLFLRVCVYSCVCGYSSACVRLLLCVWVFSCA